MESEHEAGNADVPDAASAANQFLGMIANYVLWPRMLLTDWNPAPSDVHDAVEQAVQTMLARYAPYHRRVRSGRPYAISSEPGQSS